jgi:ATP-dependent Zn protease
LTVETLLAAIREGRNALPEKIRERVSVHEAGHAIAALSIGLGEPQSLTIHDWGGATIFAGERRAMTGLDIVKVIAQLLAGREAEKLVYGDFTAGAGGGEQSDLARATMLAAAYEGSFGLGSLGPIWLGEPDQLSTPMRLVAFSGKVGEILQHAGAAARRTLIENRPALERLAKALCEASYLDGSQIKKVVGVIRKAKIEPLCANSPAERGENAEAASHDEHMEG